MVIMVQVQHGELVVLEQVQPVKTARDTDVVVVKEQPQAVTARQVSCSLRNIIAKGDQVC